MHISVLITRQANWLKNNQHHCTEGSKATEVSSYPVEEFLADKPWVCVQAQLPTPPHSHSILPIDTPTATVPQPYIGTTASGITVGPSPYLYVSRLTLMSSPISFYYAHSMPSSVYQLIVICAGGTKAPPVLAMLPYLAFCILCEYLIGRPSYKHYCANPPHAPVPIQWS